MKLQVPEQGQGQQKALVAQSSRPTSGPFASMAARAFGRRLRPKKAAGLAGMASLVLPRKQSAAKPSPPKSPRRPGGKPVKTAEAPPPDPAQVSAASAIQKAFRPRINQRILAATTLQSAAAWWPRRHWRHALRAHGASTCPRTTRARSAGTTPRHPRCARAGAGGGGPHGVRPEATLVRVCRHSLGAPTIVRTAGTMTPTRPTTPTTALSSVLSRCDQATAKQWT